MKIELKSKSASLCRFGKEKELGILYKIKNRKKKDCILNMYIPKEEIKEIFDGDD